MGDFLKILCNKLYCMILHSMIVSLLDIEGKYTKREVDIQANPHLRTLPKSGVLKRHMELVTEGRLYSVLTE